MNAKHLLLTLSSFLLAVFGLQQSAIAQYCTPAYTTSCNTYYMTVNSFSTTGGSINITNNNTSCANTNGYNYYSTMGHTTFPSSTVNFSVSVGPNYPVQVYIWVDWNQDDDFYDAGEQVAFNTNVAASATWSGSFDVPSSAVPGQTRMRIRTLYYLSSGMHPCNTLPYGEAEDYNFSVVPPYNDDAGIASILSPTLPTCDLDSVNITAVLVNNGLDTLQNCSIHYQIGSSAIVSQYYTGSVAPLNGTDTVSLGVEDFSNGDELEIWTSDPNGNNDSLSINDMQSLIVSSGLSGTYSIPGDYSTIAAARDDLATFGVCGDVVFNLSPGTYTEQVSFPEILGTDENNTVTFQSLAGNWNSATWTWSSSGTVILDGADWITFKNLKIINTNANVVQLTGSSDHVTFEHNWMKGVSLSSSGGTYSLINMTGLCDNFTLIENKLEKGSNWFNSQSGSTSDYKYDYTIEDNWMKDQSYGYGYIYYINGMEFNRNRITNDSAFSSTYAYMAAGYWNYVNNFNVTKNYIGATAGNGWYYCLYMLNCVGSSNPRSQFANNCMITGNANLPTAYYSLYMSGCGLVDMFNNSFTHASNTSTYNVYIANGGAIELKNNNFINYASNAALYVNGAFAVTESDYNNFYSSGGQLIYYGSAFYNDLESHQNGSGQDMHSVSTDPDWEDLMMCVTCNDTIGNGGTVLSTLTDDINGNDRSVLNPDIGAVEFVSPNTFDLGPDDTLCGNEVILEAGPAQSVTWSVSENNGTPQTYTTPGVTLAASGTVPTEFEVSVAITTLYCGSGSDDIQFRLVPDATLNASIHLCADETETLNPGGGTNATYAWSTGESTATIEVSEAGSYSVTKMEEGCESEATIAVTQSTAVSIGDVEGCEADAPIAVDATIPDGVNYAWSGGNAPTSASNNFDGSGVYTVTATDNFGCVSEDEFELFVLGDPVADISYTGSGGTAIFFSSAGSQQVGPNTTYSWTFNSVDTSTDPNPVYTFPWNGVPTSYPVTLVVDNGCNTDLDNMNILIDPLSVGEVAGSSFQLYPNPTNENATFALSNTAGEEGLIEVMDVSGRVLTSQIISAGQVNGEVNLAELAAGSYLVKITVDGTSSVNSLIKQ